MTTYAIILAGGAGTRFWPASRATTPKQLLPLAGDAPLIHRTATRVLPLLTGSWSRILVATGAHLVEATRSALPDVPPENFLVEPVPRNTAPCIAWAASRVARADPSAILMVLPSDHHVGDEPRFREILERAVASAAQGTITTVGIRPTHPETGFGYIEVDGDPSASGGALPVRRFVEKPDRRRAEEFLASGRFLWNAGMFFFRAADMLAAVRAHAPELAARLDAIDAGARRGDEDGAVRAEFPGIPSVSIDQGVMEHMDRLAVVPGDFGWSDLGSWQSAWELARRDGSGNAAPDSAVLVDAKDNLVVDLSTRVDRDRVISLIGVEGLVVVQTDDALLVVPRERAQDVRAVVDRLKGSGRGGLT